MEMSVDGSASSQWPTQRRFEPPPCPEPAREQRAAASTSELGRPAACLKSRPKPRHSFHPVRSIEPQPVHDWGQVIRNRPALVRRVPAPSNPAAFEAAGPESSARAVLVIGIVSTAEERPSDTSGDAVINADLIFNDDLAAGVRRHQRDS